MKRLTYIALAILLMIGTGCGQEKKTVQLKKKALKSRGLDLQGDYRKKEIDEIMRMINNGTEGSITKAEFDVMSEKTKQKLIESGDLRLFPDAAQGYYSLSQNRSQTQSQNADSRKRETFVFQTGQSVMGYLSGRVFYSADRQTRVQIRVQGVFLNGSQIADAPNLEYVTEDYAVIYAYTPRNTRYRFGVLPQEGCLVDLNDNARYYCE